MIFQLLLIAFLISLLFVLWADVRAFDTAIDTIGLTKEEWEKNKWRFVPFTGFYLAIKYRFK